MAVVTVVHQDPRLELGEVSNIYFTPNPDVQFVYTWLLQALVLYRESKKNHCTSKGDNTNTCYYRLYRYCFAEQNFALGQ